MRTYTDADGVYVHVDDLAASLRRCSQAKRLVLEANKMMEVVAEALEGVKVAALQDAVTQAANRPRFLGLF